MSKIIGLETEGSLDPKFGGVATYRVAANGDHIANDGTVLSTAVSRAKEDVPQWKKFELGRLEIVDDAVIPGPNALPKDIEQYGKNVALTNIHKTRSPDVVAKLSGQRKPEFVRSAPTKIMPGDPNFSPLQKAINWASEKHHGPGHQERWSRVAATLGADNGHSPMTALAVVNLWNKFNRNARWTMALNAIEAMLEKERSR